MKRHLESLTIESFRGLRNLELKDLGQVNLFVGPNNSGKTSVLEAISVYCRSLDPLEWLNTSQRRESYSSSFSSGFPQPARLDMLKWLFPQSAEQTPNELFHGKVEMKDSGLFDVKSMVADYHEIRGIPDETTLKRIQRGMIAREPDTEYEGAELRVQLVVDQPTTEELSFGGLKSDFVFWERAPFYNRQRPPAAYTLPVRTITPISHRTDAAQVTRFSKATLSGELQEVNELIRCFDPEIIKLQPLDIGSGPRLYVEHKKSGLTPLNVFGDGLRRAVMIALTLPQVKKGVLLIDEIETAIHISVLNEVYKWLFDACQRYDIQLFATTHSLEAVDALLGAHSAPYDGLVTYHLEQAGQPAKRLEGELLNRLRNERGLDVR